MTLEQLDRLNKAHDEYKAVMGTPAETEAAKRLNAIRMEIAFPNILQNANEPLVIERLPVEGLL